MAYKWDNSKRQQYKALCENGIGYNIKYAKGTFKYDKEKGKLIPTQEKAKLLGESILDYTTEFITVEGGKRGGKDVYSLFFYAHYLMYCPNKLHLVTGHTTGHAVKTVLEADGFGLQYLLPHGQVVKDRATSRVVFVFIDYFGVEKTVDFYAGGQAGDEEPFRGNNYGSHYANEAIKQNISVILEGVERTMASKWRKVIHTQNPMGGSYLYYEDYEKNRKFDYTQIEKILEEKKFYEHKLEHSKLKYEKMLSELDEKKTQVFLNVCGLDNMEQLEKLAYEKDTFQEIFKAYKKELALNRFEVEKAQANECHKEIIDFEYMFPNPNNVQNGLNFRYFHFTFEDNLSMTDYQRDTIRNNSDKTSVRYKREILGLRAAAEGAIWDTLTEENILRGEKPLYFSGDRYLSVDFGMKNAFVISDWEVDMDTMVCKCWNEKRFDGRKQEQEQEIDGVLATTSLYADMIQDVIEKHNNGAYDAIIVDPSATALINELSNRGFSVIKAKNDVGTRREKYRADKPIDKSITGIWLVRDGFARNKIFIHESCKDGLEECEGYVFDPKQLLIGKEVPYKVNDHFPDCVRYLINTIVRKVVYWVDNGEETIYD